MSHDSEQPILQQIHDLVAEEHQLRSTHTGIGLNLTERLRLEAIEQQLDRCWDLLRRRRANPAAEAAYPPAPDPSNELDGPEPEPPHLEHGVHEEGPAPDPGVPRNIP